MNIQWQFLFTMAALTALAPTPARAEPSEIKLVQCTDGSTLPLGAPCSVPITQPDNFTQRQTLAVDIVTAAYPPNQREALFSSMMATMSAQMEGAFSESQDAPIGAGAKEIIDKYLVQMRADASADLARNSAGMFSAIANAYARMFSLPELTDIRAFALSPSGASFLQRSSSLLADPEVAAWNQAHFARMMERIAAHRERMTEELKAQAKISKQKQAKKKRS